MEEEENEDSEFLSTNCETESNISRCCTLVNFKPVQAINNLQRSKSFEFTGNKSLSPLRKIHNELQEQIIKSEKVKGINAKTKGIKKEGDKIKSTKPFHLENEKLQKILTRKAVKKYPTPIEILRKIYFENYTFEMVKVYIPNSFSKINGTQGILDLLSEMTEEFHKVKESNLKSENHQHHS